MLGGVVPSSGWQTWLRDFANVTMELNFSKGGFQGVTLRVSPKGHGGRPQRKGGRDT